MDFAALFKDTTTVEIKLPDGSPSGIVAEVRSPTSDEVKAVDRAWQNKALRSKGDAPSMEELERHGVDRVIAAIASWTWPKDATFDGQSADKTDAFKKKVLSHKGGDFILKQIVRAMGDEAGFFVGLAKN